LEPTAQPPVLSYTIAPSRRGYGLLAIGGTFLFPGVGHFIFGAYRRGTIWLTVNLGVQILSLALMCNRRLLLYGLALNTAWIVLSICIGIDAFLTARRSNREFFSAAWPRYAAGILLIFLGCGRSFAENLAIFPFTQRHVRTFRQATKPMSPTVQPGDCFVVAIGQAPSRWDIIAFHEPSQSRQNLTYIDRVVGLPGETVEIAATGLMINGKLAQLPPSLGPYAQPRMGPQNGCQGNPIHLGPDEYFLLGDNTAIARDSRYWDDPPPGRESGALPAANVVGVVRAIYWPPHRFRIFDR
jgi:signal peptidase I